MRERLPLLAGDELAGADRRAVERHLIGCDDCRDVLASHREALGVLRRAAGVPPTRPDAPSLWPALARQIREERRRPAAAFSFWPLAWGWPTGGLAVAAGLLVAVGLTGMAYHAGQFAAPPQLATAPKPAPEPVAEPVEVADDAEADALLVEGEPTSARAESLPSGIGGTR